MEGHSTRLKYFKWDDKYLTEKPFQLYADIPVDSPDEVRGNVRFQEGDPELVRDVRSSGEAFTLDEKGFQYVDFSTDFSDWEIREAVQTSFYGEMERLIKKEVDGADLVHIFEYRLRQSDSAPSPGTTVNLSDPTRYLSPAGTVHVDLTAWEVLEKVKLFTEHDPALRERLLRGRVRVINVWRPLHDDIKSWPLAVCDGSSVANSDLVAVDQVRRHSRGEGYVLKYRPGFQWYYMGNMTRQQALLLKNFDSKEMPAKFAPHAAFRLPDTLGNAGKRTSIEVRALVFTEGLYG